MTIYIAVNWLFCILTSMMLVHVLTMQKFLFVKPSIIVILFFHVMIQWSATVQSGMIEEYLYDPFHFALLVQGFPFLGLCGSLLIGRSQARAIWQRITNKKSVLDQRLYSRTVFMLTLFIVVIVAVYLVFVPLSKTGLFTIFTDPLNSAQAREDSLKLLDNVFLRYAYSLMTATAAPLLASTLIMRAILNANARSFFCIAILVLHIIGIMVAVSLTGARSFVLSIILTISLTFFLRAGLPLNPVYIIMSLIATLSGPTILTIMREGQELTMGSFWQYLTEGIFGRVFNTPMLTGLWHVHYVQLHGFFGIRGISRLATLFGFIPVNVPNLIGLTYASSKIETVSANTSFVFAYYSYFDLYSFLLVLPLLWLLDVALTIYKRLNDTLLLPCVAAVSVTSTSFISSDYTVVLLTHGFAVLLLTAWMLGKALSTQHVRLVSDQLPAMYRRLPR